MNLAMQPKVENNSSNEQLWQAVESRDASLDGKFVYAVSSTQIYCRPSCPSRRPRRDRVSFFDGPDAAERAGFRACKRCQPGSGVDAKSDMVKRTCEILDRAVEESNEPITLTELSELLGISSFHLQRTFKKALGISPRQYAESRRANKFKESVREGQPITRAMYDAGYSSSSRLYERSTVELGMTPATYGRSGRGARITYVVTPSELGWLLVAATSKGVCAIRLGSTEEELEQDLKQEFSAAEIIRDTGPLSSSVQKVLEHIRGNRLELNVPLDVQATAFQRLVWEALRTIPYGATRSYGEVAESIGRPTAVRAVARACATNPVALAIPCHRVIGRDNSLSGYRWGLERKKKLLEKERKVTG